MNNANEKPKYHMKIIVCGAGAVGKTAIVRRYVQNKFQFDYLLTVGMDPSNRLIEIDDMLINLIIFDVAGQKRFQTLRDVFFRKANGAIMVFDLTRPETVDDLYEWKEQIDERLGKDRIPLILVGNKSDLDEYIQVDYAMLEDRLIPDFHPIKYLETSAYLDKNVRETFEILTRTILVQEGILSE
jgi:small GTP-binding protein